MRLRGAARRGSASRPRSDLDFGWWPGVPTGPKPSFSGRCGSRRQTGSSTSTPSSAAGSARSPRASGRRRRASVRVSSRSRTSSCSSTRGRANCTRSPARRSLPRTAACGRTPTGSASASWARRRCCASSARPEPNPRAFTALARFLEACWRCAESGCAAGGSTRSRSPFSSSSCGSRGTSPIWARAWSAAPVASSWASRRAGGGAVCAACTPRGSLTLSPEGLSGVASLLAAPLAGAHGAGLGDRARREALSIVTSSYEEHGGFRLRTLSA